MADDMVNIHAARTEAGQNGWWFQLDKGWYFVDTSRSGISSNVLETDLSTRPVRIATTDPGEPSKCACHDCHELLPDDWTHGAYCGQCINRCEPAKPAPPPGLSAEQEIRARAAELYWNGSPGTWTLTDIVAWIRDGKEPSDV